MASQLPKSLATWSLIRSFLSLAYFLEYGPAARELNVSVPTLRRRIQRLETYLGHSLLVYERRTLQLTEAGQRALKIATKADRRIATIRDNQDQCRQASLPPLRLAMDENVLTYFWIPFCVRHGALLERYQISVHVHRVPDFSPGADTDCALSLGDAPQLAAITEPVGSFGVYFAGHEASVARHGIPTFNTLGEHTFIRPETELFETMGGALLNDLERLSGATIRVDSAGLADQATNLGLGFYFGTPWLEREGYVLFPGFPVAPMVAYACFSEDFAVEPANRKFIDTMIEEAKQFFGDRDLEQKSVPVASKVGLNASKEFRPLNELMRGGPQDSAKKGGEAQQDKGQQDKGQQDKAQDGKG